jgi:hypothetical protein
VLLRPNGKVPAAVVEAPNLTKASRRCVLRGEKSWLSLYEEDGGSESSALMTTALTVQLVDSVRLTFSNFDGGKPAGHLKRTTKAKKVKDLVVFGSSLTPAVRRRLVMCSRPVRWARPQFLSAHDT